jgi:hypothetical protein
MEEEKRAEQVVDDPIPSEKQASNPESESLDIALNNP